QNGVSILYQYMHRYVNNDNMTICKDAAETLTRVAADSRILKKPVSFILNRLKTFQNILIVQNQDYYYLINTTDRPVESVRIDLERTNDFISDVSYTIDKINKTVVFPIVDKLSYVRFKTSDKIFKRKYHMKIHEDFGVIKFSNANIYINLAGNEKYLNLNKSMIKINPYGVFVDFLNHDSERLGILKEISLREIYKLKAGQFFILLREHLFLGRKFSTRNYLNDPGKIENVTNW
ncbi:MAG TPA: hypothetical protein VHP36_03320, partial [Chitinispirillaceae bacterium]|nr:hypothetical protein [Chitinispirillaceae bacterium]